jgi:polysaccharide export outer membrane protein
MRSTILSVAIAGYSYLLPGVCLANYLVQKGDVLEMSVAGVPDLRQESRVDLDGNVSFPLIKSLHAAGVSLTKIESDVKEQLSKSLYQHVVDGKELVTAIPSETISVRISAYRPIYVDGDVSKPGAQTFSPGMTVRQAISLAGGYEIMRFRMNNPFIEGADLKSDYESLWLDYVHAQGEVWRLKRLLSPERDLSLEKMTDAPLPESILAQTRALAQQKADQEKTIDASELAHLTDGKNILDHQIDSLMARQVKDDENAKVDSDEYENLKAFSSHGNLPMTRLSEARRLLLFSATQALQTQVQTAETHRLQADADHKLQRFSQDIKAQAVKELAEQEMKVEAIRSKLQAAGEKIAYIGIIRSQMTRGRSGSAAIQIMRGADNDATVVEATPNTLLSPGDAVDVALRTEVPVPSSGPYRWCYAELKRGRWRRQAVTGAGLASEICRGSDDGSYFCPDCRRHIVGQAALYGRCAGFARLQTRI